MDEKDPKIYELAVLLKSEDDLAAIGSFLKEHKAAMEGEVKSKKIALAYPISKHTEAIFVNGRFSALPENAKQMEKDLTLRPEVLRSLILTIKTTQKAIRAMGGDRTTPRIPRTPATSTVSREASSGSALSNEALEKKIEEILK
jgi:ribosomal protein S6